MPLIIIPKPIDNQKALIIPIHAMHNAVDHALEVFVSICGARLQCSTSLQASRACMVDHALEVCRFFGIAN